RYAATSARTTPCSRHRWPPRSTAAARGPASRSARSARRPARRRSSVRRCASAADPLPYVADDLTTQVRGDQVGRELLAQPFAYPLVLEGAQVDLDVDRGRLQRGAG